MWIYSALGAFSVVTAPYEGVGVFVVRSRCRAHLGRLVGAMLTAGDPECRTFSIKKTKDRDYPFRVVMDAHQWGVALRMLTETIGENVKESIAAMKDGKYYRVALNVYEATLPLDDRRETAAKILRDSV